MTKCCKCGADCEADELSASLGFDVMCDGCMDAWERKHQHVIDYLNSSEWQPATKADGDAKPSPPSPVQK